MVAHPRPRHTLVAPAQRSGVRRAAHAARAWRAYAFWHDMMRDKERDMDKHREKWIEARVRAMRACRSR